MGKHVDTTSPVDAFGESTRVLAAHRKPGEPMHNMYATPSTNWDDPWSGNPDTDKAWRSDYEEAHPPWS